MYKLPATKNISSAAIDSFVDDILSWPRNDSLMCFIVVKECDKIKSANNFSEKKKLFNKLIDRFADVNAKEKYFGKTIDLRDWKINSIAEPVSLHDRIKICPICSKRGVIQKPYKKSGYKGETIHVIKPFGMGYEIIESCKYA